MKILSIDMYFVSTLLCPKEISWMKLKNSIASCRIVDWYCIRLLTLEKERACKNINLFSLHLMAHSYWKYFEKSGSKKFTILLMVKNWKNCATYNFYKFLAKFLWFFLNFKNKIIKKIDYVFLLGISQEMVKLALAGFAPFSILRIKV